jgi:hypothetical protein
MVSEQRIVSELSVMHCADGLAVASVCPVCVVVWRESVTQRRFDIQRKGLAEVVRRHPQEAVMLCVIEPTTAPPGAELRRASAEMIAGHGDALKGLCCVIEGQGFRASVGRSVLAGMAYLLAGRGPRQGFVATVDDALRFLSADIKPATLRRLAPAIAELRTTLAPAVEPFAVVQS